MNMPRDGDTRISTCRSAITRVLLTVTMIVACPGVLAEVAEAQTITFPGGIPPENITTQVAIEASAEQVWQVLTDFSAYPIWNPFIYPVKGEPRPGNTLEITIHPGTRSIAYQATVVAAQPNRELTLQISSAGAFEITFSFMIEPLPGGRTRLISRESHKGLAVVLAWPLLQDIQSGLDAMTKAVRNRAELQRLVPHHT